MLRFFSFRRVFDGRFLSASSHYAPIRGGWMKAPKSILYIHQKIMEAKDTFVSDDYFDPDKASSAADEKRNFLLDQLLQDQGFFQMMIMITNESM